MRELRTALLAFAAGTATDANALALQRAGLIDGTVLEWSGKATTIVNAHINERGADFLALTQNETIWNRVDALVTEKVGDTSLANWIALLEREHKAALELLPAPKAEQEPVKEPDADSVPHDV